MKDNNDFNDIGEQIRDGVQDALESMDFNKLNSVISDSVDSALSEARKQFREVGDQARSAAELARRVRKNPDEARRHNDRYGRGSWREVRGSGNGNGDDRTGSRQKGKGNDLSFKGTRRADSVDSGRSDSNQAFRKRQSVKVKMNQVGSVSGVLFTVFGSIGTGLAGIPFLFLIVYVLINPVRTAFIGLLILGILLVIFAFMIGTGNFQRARLKRVKRYLQICGDKTWCDIQELAAHVGKSRRYVIRDLRRMLKLNIFPEGHLDQKETCLILDDTTYRQYLDLQKAGNGQIRKDKEAVEKQTEAKAVGQEAVPKTELEILIEQGNDCIRKLREMNDAIEGEVISEKLTRLEHILTEIFGMVREHPQQMPQMQKFMDYYLPTTLKLVEAYADFDGVGIQGENIINAKREIEQTLDTINKAFEKLLDDLFRDVVFDATTDAQVLQTMLKQGGLTEEGAFTNRSDKQ